MRAGDPLQEHVITVVCPERLTPLLDGVIFQKVSSDLVPIMFENEVCRLLMQFFPSTSLAAWQGTLHH